MQRLSILVLACSTLSLSACVPGAELVGDYTGGGTFQYNVGGRTVDAPLNGKRRVELAAQDLAVKWDDCALVFEPRRAGVADLGKSPVCTTSSSSSTLALQFRDGELAERSGQVDFSASGSFIYQTTSGRMSGTFKIEERWRKTR